MASAPGYVNQAYDAHGDYSSLVILSVASPSFVVTFHLAPQSRVTGTILDEAGEGVRSATVDLVSVPLTVHGNRTSRQMPLRTEEHCVWLRPTTARGVYEFAGLMPEGYLVRVQARPWHAQGTRSMPQPDGGAQREPDLDVAYALVWYPGTIDHDKAEVITLRPGDQRQADFQLSPSPALHLQITLPLIDNGGGRQASIIPFIEKIHAGGGAESQFGPGATNVISGSSEGQIDIGRHTPGTYRVSLLGHEHNSAVLHIAEGSSQAVDLRETQPGMSKVMIEVDEDDDSPMSVELVDAGTSLHNRTQDAGAMPYARGPLVTSRLK